VQRSCWHRSSLPGHLNPAHHGRVCRSNWNTWARSGVSCGEGPSLTVELTGARWRPQKLTCTGLQLDSIHWPPKRDGDEQLGTPTKLCKATSIEKQFRGCSHLFMFSLHHLLGPQVAPTARPLSVLGGRAAYARPNLESLPAPSTNIATCLNRAIGAAGLAPAGFRPCRLLPSRLPLPLRQNFLLAALATVGGVRDDAVNLGPNQQCQRRQVEPQQQEHNAGQDPIRGAEIGPVAQVCPEPQVDRDQTRGPRLSSPA
jgi:hypothetical protein